jgi:4-hydroxy-3-methylbut-2-enyl diphosphate reductase
MIGRFYFKEARPKHYLCVSFPIVIKKFEIPAYYRSSITGRIKEFRRQQDLRKQDFTPTLLDFGPVRFVLARHFGFCYGVENAIEISYRAIEENPGKNIYLLSQMIHNQEVNFVVPAISGDMNFF